MGKPEDKRPGNKRLPAREGLSYDSRGNAVWQWAVDSGRHLIDSTTHLLKRLEVPGLKLEEDASTQEKKSAVQSGPDQGGAIEGYDPYGHRRVAPGPRPNDHETSFSTKASSVVVAAAVSAGLNGSR